MKKWYIIATALLLLIALAYISGRLYFHWTDGFSVSNIQSNSSYNAAWDIPSLSELESNKIANALDQKYYYLGKGCQTYVFVSEDGKYVIKFFKHKHLRLDWWWKYLPLPSSYQEFRTQKLKLKKAKLKALFASVKLAYDKLQEETGILYLHLNKGKSPVSQLVIYDKLGSEHLLNLNQLEFYLQLYAEPVYPIIKTLGENKNFSEATKVFDRLISVLISRSKKGIADLDHAMIQNLALLENRALIIDVGQLISDDKIKKPENYQQDIRMRSQPFIKWLKENQPILVPYFERSLNEALNQTD